MTTPEERDRAYSALQDDAILRGITVAHYWIDGGAAYVPRRSPRPADLVHAEREGKALRSRRRGQRTHMMKVLWTTTLLNAQQIADRVGHITCSGVSRAGRVHGWARPPEYAHRGGDGRRIDQLSRRYDGQR